MKINYLEDVRNEFRRLKDIDQQTNGTYEIRNAQFRVDGPTIFGAPNEEYIAAELQWYKTQSLNVHDLFKIYGKTVKIWENVSDKLGCINSNYGWCIYSGTNHHQYEEVRNKLTEDPYSRQACMYYTRPTMHTDDKKMGRKDHMCTTHVQYFTNNGYVECQVNMRSNDAVFGFINDLAWQRFVLFQLARDLKLQPGSITWSAGSLHVYERHWHLIK